MDCVSVGCSLTIRTMRLAFSLSDDIIDAILTTCATAFSGSESLSSNGASVRVRS